MSGLSVFQLMSTHEGVKRTKYFDDDEKYNLKDLVSAIKQQSCKELKAF